MDTTIPKKKIQNESTYEVSWFEEPPDIIMDILLEDISRYIPMGSTSKCQEGVDRISELPNSLLCHILSFLPILDAAQTTILSRRWENLWTPLPKLVFDDDCFPYSWIESNMIVFLIHGLNPITFKNSVLNFIGVEKALVNQHRII
ncbi:unnamed protein product [Malus baccata var. baccata]